MSWTNEARRYYDEPHRHYHTWNHIRYCLDLLLPLNEKIPLTDWMCLRYALVYHDAVYDTHSNDSEERSAQLARNELSSLGVTEDDVAEVERLIRLTKTHDPMMGDSLGALMCDIDCAILGDTPQNYDDYAEGVRVEYGWVSDSDWKKGRSEVLTHFLERSQIFLSPFFQHLEQQARDNIERELEDLQ